MATGISLLWLTTKYHRLGDLNERNKFSYSSGNWEVLSQGATGIGYL